MREMLKNKFTVVCLVFALLVAGGGVGLRFFTDQADAYAGAEVVGNPEGASYRALISSGGTDRVNRIIYFAAGQKTPVAANTPIVSGTLCDQAGNYHWAKVTLSGTLTGTNPTAAVKWQNSKDNGATWTDVGTWTTINATVTPASQEQTVADHGDIVLMNANTPVTTPAVVYGDCWRASITFGGTGAIGGNIAIIGLEK